MAQEKKTEEVEQITGYSRTWSYALVKRYNELGVQGLGERRQFNQGAKPLINDLHQAQLWQALQEKARLRRIMEWTKSGRLVNSSDRNDD